MNEKTGLIKIAGNLSPRIGGVKICQFFTLELQPPLPLVIEILVGIFDFMMHNFSKTDKNFLKVKRQQAEILLQVFKV